MSRAAAEQRFSELVGRAAAHYRPDLWRRRQRRRAAIVGTLLVATAVLVAVYGPRTPSPMHYPVTPFSAAVCAARALAGVYAARVAAGFVGVLALWAAIPYVDPVLIVDARSVIWVGASFLVVLCSAFDHHG